MSIDATLQYSKAECHEAIQRFVEELRNQHPQNRLPRGGHTESAYQQWAEAHASLVPSSKQQRQAHNNSWALAMQEAEQSCSGRRPYPSVSKEVAAEVLQAALASTGKSERVLSEPEYESYREEHPDAPTRTALKRAYGPTWKETLSLINAQPAWQQHNPAREEQMLTALHEVAVRIGRAPSKSEFDRLRLEGSVTADRYVDVFDSWTNAVTLAGFSPTFPDPRALALSSAATSTHRSSS